MGAVSSAKGGYTALVTVRSRCTCGAERWFLCRCSEAVAEYDVPGFDGIASCPDPEAVAIIMHAHPGCEFVYLSLGDYYASLVRAAYKKRAPSNSASNGPITK